jgi:membrane fusion protein, multidrug efflux system
MPDRPTIVSLRSDTAEALAPKREAPQKQPERPAAMPSASELAARSRRRPWRRWALFALLPGALSAGGYWYVTGGQVMSTDDAYVQAETVGISGLFSSHLFASFLRMKVISRAARQRALRTFWHPAVLIVL